MNSEIFLYTYFISIIIIHTSKANQGREYFNNSTIVVRGEGANEDETSIFGSVILRRKRKNRTKNRQSFSSTDREYQNLSKDLQSHSEVPWWSSDCLERPCLHGGSCEPDPLGSGVRCRCPLGSGGVSCEKAVSVKYPKFSGDGFMVFPRLLDIHQTFNVFIEFRPDTYNGLILVSLSDRFNTEDFLSISLINGYIEFRFDCGSGPALIRTSNKVLLQEWNVLELHRVDRYGWMVLNDGPPAKGRSKGRYQRINFTGPLYMGGYTNLSNSETLGYKTGTLWGFVGCVSQLTINERKYDMRKETFTGDAIDGSNVEECSDGLCDSIQCYQEGKCQTLGPDSVSCSCQFGTSGPNCQFSLGNSCLHSCHIEITLKPYHSSDGLILYNGDSTERSGDFLALSVRKGHLEFRFDLGTGPAIIRSRNVISLNEWHIVRLSTRGREGWMIVDGMEQVTGRSEGSYTQLSLNLDLYIGGHSNYDHTSSQAQLSRSFLGCVQKVVMNGQHIRLTEDKIEGINIKDCDFD